MTVVGSAQVTVKKPVWFTVEGYGQENLKTNNVTLQRNWHLHPYS